MIEAIDIGIYKILFRTITPTNTFIMMGVTFFASARVLITITIIALLILKNRRNSKYMTINLIAVFILNRIIKFVVKRPRPNALALVIEKGYSFPSAHAMIGFAFYGLIIYLIMKTKINKKIKIISTIILSILILLIGISRIYLGVHYATDVISGFIIGLIYLIVFIKLMNKHIFDRSKIKIRKQK